MEEQQPGKDLTGLPDDDQHKSANQEAPDNGASESRTRISGVHSESSVAHAMGNAIGEEHDVEVLPDTLDRRVESDDDSVFDTDHEESFVAHCDTDYDVQRRKSSGVNSSHMSHSSTRQVESTGHRSQVDVINVNVNVNVEVSPGERQQRPAGPSVSREMQPRLSTPAASVSGVVRTRARAQTINDPNDVIQEVARSLIDLSLNFERLHAARALSAQRQHRSSSVSETVGSYLSSVAGVASNLVSSVSNTLHFVRRTSSQFGESLRSSLRRRSLSSASVMNYTRMHVSLSAGNQAPYDAQLTSPGPGGIVINCDQPAELSTPVTRGEEQSSEAHEQSNERPLDSIHTQQSVTNESSSCSSTITECDADADADTDANVGYER